MFISLLEKHWYDPSYYYYLSSIWPCFVGFPLLPDLVLVLLGVIYHCSSLFIELGQLSVLLHTTHVNDYVISIYKVTIELVPQRSQCPCTFYLKLLPMNALLNITPTHHVPEIRKQLLGCCPQPLQAAWEEFRETNTAMLSWSIRS